MCARYRYVNFVRNIIPVESGDVNIVGRWGGACFMIFVRSGNFKLIPFIGGPLIFVGRPLLFVDKMKSFGFV